MKDQAEVMRVAAWKRYPWLRHGFSTRLGGVSTVYRLPLDGRTSGDLNLGWTKDDDPANVSENRRRTVEAVTGASAETPPLITVRQVHSALSLRVPAPPAFRHSDFVTAEGRAIQEADGLMTGAAGILLGIQTADCVPVFVVDTRLRVVAVFHAGWRGTAARTVELGVSKMVAEFGSRAENLEAAIGPSIGACCYGVGEEVRDAFTSRFGYGEELFSRGEGTPPEHLDLWEANRRQLFDSGLAAGNISLIGECTGCSGLPGPRRYFSHRSEEGFTGRMMSVIGTAQGGA